MRLFIHARHAGRFLWPAVVIALAVLYGYRASWVAIVIVLLLGICSLRATWTLGSRSFLELDEIDGAILLLLATKIDGLFHSIYTNNTVRSIAGFCTLAALYYLVKICCTQNSQQSILLVAGTVFAGFIGFGTVATTAMGFARMARFTFGDLSNLKAAFTMPVPGPGTEPLGVLIALMPFGILAAVRFWDSNPGIRYFSLATVMLLMVGAGLSFSRGVYLALAVFIVGIGFALWCFGGRIRKQFLLTVVCLVFMAGAALLPVRVAVLTTAEIVRTSTQIRSIRGRLQLWEAYGSAIASHPAFGVGQGNVGLIPLRIKDRDPAEGAFPLVPLNTGLLVLLEEGWCGLAAYLLLMALLVRRCFRVFHLEAYTNVAKIEVAVTASMIAALVIRDLTTCSLLTHDLTSALMCVLFGFIVLRSRTVAARNGSPLRVRKSFAVVLLLASVASAALLIRVQCSISHYRTFAKCFRLGQTDDAGKALDHALDITHDDAFILSARGLLEASTMDAVPFRWPLTRLRGKLGLEQVSALQRARDDYSTVLELNPVDGAAWLNLGWIEYFTGRDDAAMIAFQKSAQLDPWNGLTQVSLGLLYEQRGNTEATWRSYTEAIRLMPSLLNSTFFEELKDRDPVQAQRAIDVAQKSLEEQFWSTHSPVIAAKAGALALHEQKIDRAKFLLEYAILHSPTLLGAWINLGTVHEKSGDFKEARHCYEAASALNPFNTQAALRLAGYAAENHDPAAHDRYHWQAEIGKRYFGSTLDTNEKLTQMYGREPETPINIAPRTFVLYCSERRASHVTAF